MEPTEPGDRVEAALAALHAPAASRHDQQRRRLLASLDDSSVDGRPAGAGRRVALGGLTLGAVAAALLAALWLTGAAPTSNAMERMAAALDQVTAYRFRMESVYDSWQGEGRRVREVLAGTVGVAPPGLRAEIHIVQTPRTDANAGPPKVLVNLEETHRAPGEGPGILIDHLKRQYWWVDGGVRADTAPANSPQVILYMVRQRRGRVLQSLGQRQVAGRDAIGFEIALDGPPRTELGPAGFDELDGPDPQWLWQGQTLQVWVDPNTDLPIEIHGVRRGDDFETTYRFTDLEWNVETDPDTFTPAAPVGYEELPGPPPSE
ncbi:hypothetical protein KOR34_49800 [Posidoniimonas corsicana]|uniref:Uncharacterized protein n=1 Tax=Posidoniimonas corsicana TaxID=1938618 RepID=A0A5C5UVP5_9BACT|nr:hypothetical protein [Posidoniimonas corsicana]TWT30421.1 hypothetical protein KOR34_49800 [Posidoniimonas corsicana]